jgi:Arc/MetJ-type ribon-helix-helix transcriptional regulator
MVRKTVAINDELFKTLEFSELMSKYQSFSELVSNALQLLIEKQRREKYKKAMIEASRDELYRQDIYKIEDDFKYCDAELVK